MAPDADPLARFVTRVRGLGVEPNARELAEALWLARHVGPASLTTPAVPERREATAEPEPFATPRPPERKATRARRTGGDEAVRVYPEQPAKASSGPGAAFARIRVGQATALPHALQLQRALRPLQRHRPPGRTPGRVLDEQTTAERAAESGLLLPVMLATGRRQARLQLLMDASTSTVVWDRTLAELRQICAGTGAFREVSVHYVHQGRDGRPLIGRTRDENRPLRAAEQLRDPTGRQLTMLLSDCAGPLWRSGRMHRLLHHWALAGPVALVQPLPQRMWPRTHLPAVPGTLRRREGLGARLEFAPRQGDVPAPALALPVLGLTGTAFGVWARLLAADTGLSLPAAAGWVRPAHPPSAGPRTGAAPPPPAGALVQAFRNSASPAAMQLAVSLSAVPLTLPVMQIVQRALLPGTGPPELAEILLSGLLRRGADDGWYEFLPGVQELLLAMLPKGDALLVLQLCGAYVERHFGRRADNFPALAAARLTGTEVHRGAGGGGARVPDAFAEVSSRILRRYAPKGQATRPVRDRVTLVHAGCDRSWASWMRRVLAAHGHEVVLRRWSIDSGQSLVEVLTETLEAGPGQVLILLGRASFQGSLQGEEEWDVAWGVLSPGQVGRLEAVHFGPLPLSDPPPLVSQLEPLQLAGADESTAEELLLAHLGLDDGVRCTPVRGEGTRFPNTPPQVWEGVPKRNIAFTGREELLEEMWARLVGRGEAFNRCVLTGPAGVGKTQLALEYAHRFRAEYDAVWWIEESNPSAVRRLLHRLLDRIEAGTHAPPDQEGRAVRGEEAGRREKRRLIVVNHHEPGESFVPGHDGVTTHVLATARHARSDRPDDTLPVGNFERRESIAYVRRHTEHRTPAEMVELAEAVNDLPLSLVLAARLLSDSRRSVTEVVDVLNGVVPGQPPPTVERPPRDRMAELLRRSAVRIGPAGSDRRAFRGGGFFVAPEWVLTCAHVAADGDAGLTVIGFDDAVHAGRLRWTLPPGAQKSGAAWQLPDLALVHVPGATDYGCLWLSDGSTPPGGEVEVYGHPQGTEGIWARLRAVAQDTGGGLALSGHALGAGVSGSAVVDSRTGAVVGVLRSRRSSGDFVASDIAVLSELGAQGGDSSIIWSEVVRSSDLHHLAEYRASGDESWTDVQIALSPVGEGGFSPDLRTELYAALAQLRPPTAASSWRDLIGALVREARQSELGEGEVLDRVVTYSARICSDRADDSVGELREWVERAAPSLSFGSREEITRIVGRGSDRRVPSVDISVEVTPLGRGREQELGMDLPFAWKIWILSDGAPRPEAYTHGDRGAPFAEHPGVSLYELRASLMREVHKALRRVKIPGIVPTVQFSLPRELLDEPVERWRTPTPGPGLSPLSERCHVVLRADRGTHFGPEARSARWSALSGGPLLMAPQRHPQGAARRGSPQSDGTAPLNAVPVVCGAVDALDDVLQEDFPLVLWRRDRRYVSRAAFFMDVGEALDGAADIHELLTRIRALRIEKAEWARDLAVLYDPPGTGLPEDAL